MTDKMLAFDMDGTIADLYGVNGWLSKLRKEDASPYLEAKPMWDVDKLNELINKLKQAGWEIAIITWLSKESSPEYAKTVREAKKAWLLKWGFPYDHFHGLKYGTTKADAVRRKASQAILIDDNKKVRDGWHLGETINPKTCDLIDFLASLL